ncbi:MAG: hypothetical protein ACK4KV_13445 [Rhodocyclaceae bacterium]
MRRATLGALASAMALIGCGGGSSSSLVDSGDIGGSADAGSSTGNDGTSGGTCSQIPEETAGPYPADGSGASGTSINVLANNGVVRSDIRSNIGAETLVSGTPMTLTITLQNVSGDCAPLAGYAIYIWQCDINGEYSAYSGGSNGNHLSDTYLRGVQVTDAAGQVTFTTIFPGCYIPRVAHIHVEVFPSLALATSSNNKIATSQFAFDDDLVVAVYASDSYRSAGNQTRLAQSAVTNANDSIFSDGVDTQLLTLSGDVVNGFEATITMAVSA